MDTAIIWTDQENCSASKAGRIAYDPASMRWDAWVNLTGGTFGYLGDFGARASAKGAVEMRYRRNQREGQ